MSDESSTKPYLIRAIFEWCTDLGYTPYLAVQVDAQTVVPREYVKNGEIVLNISPLATSRLTLGNEFIDFLARFGGAARSISVPVKNVSAVYARENGHGLAFEVAREEALVKDSPPGLPALPAPATAELRPSLERPALASVEPAKSNDTPLTPDDGPKGRPRLTIVK
jgi:stringent starvation protein B